MFFINLFGFLIIYVDNSLCEGESKSNTFFFCTVITIYTGTCITHEKEDASRWITSLLINIVIVSPNNSVPPSNESIYPCFKNEIMDKLVSYIKNINLIFPNRLLMLEIFLYKIERKIDRRADLWMDRCSKDIYIYIYIYMSVWVCFRFYLT